MKRRSLDPAPLENFKLQLVIRGARWPFGVLDVVGMTCGGCAGSVQRTLSKVDDLSHAEVTLHPGVASVVADPERVTSAQIEAAITGLGYLAKARPTAQSEHASS